MASDRIILGLLALLFILGITGIFWKKTVLFLMYWTVLAGAIRKWFFPQFSDITLFSSHFLLLGVYGRFLVRGMKFPPRSSVFLFFTIVLSFWCLISLFNPRLPDMRVGVVGIVIHLFFIPLALIVPYIFSSKKKLLYFIKNYTFFSTPVLILGIVQYFSPVDSHINRYVAESMARATVGTHARITGTFPYVTGYTSYLKILILLWVYLMSIREAGPLFRMRLVLLGPLIAINLFMTGSRGPVGISFIAILLYIVIATRLWVTFLSKLAMRFILIATISLAVFYTWEEGKEAFKEAYSAFRERVENTDDIPRRLVDTFTPFKFAREAGLLGYGVGTTYQGTLRFNIDWGTMPRDFEEEPERIVLELGVIGYFVVYLFRLYLLLAFWNLYRKLRDRDLKLLALIILLFEVQFLQLTPLVFNLTTGFFYWFFSGFLFLLPRLDRISIECEASKSIRKY